jgi:hypothetical protein
MTMTDEDNCYREIWNLWPLDYKYDALATELSRPIIFLSFVIGIFKRKHKNLKISSKKSE